MKTWDDKGAEGNLNRPLFRTRFGLKLLPLNPRLFGEPRILGNELSWSDLRVIQERLPINVIVDDTREQIDDYCDEVKMSASQQVTLADGTSTAGRTSPWLVHYQMRVFGWADIGKRVLSRTATTIIRDAVSCSRGFSVSLRGKRDRLDEHWVAATAGELWWFDTGVRHLPEFRIASPVLMAVVALHRPIPREWDGRRRW